MTTAPGRQKALRLSLRWSWPLTWSLAWGLAAASCSRPGPEGAESPMVEVRIPSGASFREAVDSLQAAGLVRGGRVFRLYARLLGADRKIRSGHYLFPPGASWHRILDDLVAGRVVTEALVIPEGFTLKQMAGRIGAVTLLSADSVLAVLSADSSHVGWGLPGPGLEGYLFPDTYRFASGTPLEEVVRAMVHRYREVWTPDWVARRDSLGMTEGEVVTLASIVQAEARHPEEMPLIASVYHNRLKRGMLLQADPTVLYALGGPRPRLLFAAIDSVADHPYNTYARAGLPPGPIGSPGAAALQASLYPADTPFLYFVALPSGFHLFSRTLEEHNRAVAQARREWQAVRARQTQMDSTAGGGAKAGGEEGSPR